MSEGSRRHVEPSTAILFHFIHRNADFRDKNSRQTILFATLRLLPLSDEDDIRILQ